MEAKNDRDAVSSQTSSMEKLACIYDKIPMTQVDSLLKLDGDFLVQLVDQANNLKTKELIKGKSLLVLSVKQSGKIRHWLIKQDEGKFGIEQALFPSISSMISFYCRTQKSIVEGETVLIKNAVVDKKFLDEFSAKPSLLDKENNASTSKVSSFNHSSKAIGEKESAVINFDAPSHQSSAVMTPCKEAGMDKDSSDLADSTSSVDITASKLRFLGIGMSDCNFSSSDVLLNRDNVDCSGSPNKVSIDQKSSSEEVHQRMSSSVHTPWKCSSFKVIKQSNESLGSSSLLINSSTDRLSDPSASSSGTWPSLHLFNSESSSNGKTSIVTANVCAAPDHPSVVVENLTSSADKSANRSVSFALPAVKQSCETLGSLINTKSIEHQCSACSSSLSLDYDSIDKLELRYNIAKASSFYDFVRLYTAATKYPKPSMFALVRLAELLFKDYKQHVE